MPFSNISKSVLKLVSLLLIVSSCNSKIETKIYSPEKGEGKYILTPEVGDKPKIHGPSVFGVRPNAPFLYTVPATGRQPLVFSVENLPEGLKVNSKSGVISGTIKAEEQKDYDIVFVAKNNLGEEKKNFKIKVGETICLTPPLGWNSWNCWGEYVTQENVIASAKAMVDKGLKNYGWSYINMDDGWQSHRGGKHNAILADSIKFPNMASMCEDIHNMGLKVGIYSSPWITTYAGRVGGSSDREDGYWDITMDDRKLKPKRVNIRVAEHTFDTNDATQWAEWGIDYLKYDWNPNEPASTIRMAEALENSGRDIVYSISNTAPLEHAELFGEEVNCFRTYGDLKDRWDGKGSHKSIRDEWKAHRHWLENGFPGAPGHFPDPDMLVVGEVNTKSKNPIPSRLTADEQYSHISLWSLWAAPLLIGCPIERMDEFTVKLLTNSEVLDVNQDEKGIPGKSIIHNEDLEIVVKDMHNGTKAIGLFNLKEEEQVITLSWKDIGIEGVKNVRDLWRQKDIGNYKDSFSAVVQPHGVVLIRLNSI
ncbi:putative Ig domain-containing protein [Flavivirga algicola]|uniref:Alpha-galactosidase n=1 Tax=Flavivirga algicola TaxID=2729136 RepID=A0ABX1RTC2_9FLAO|nr:putative Ig domain-containing protein [Flavivirga algicola]NMH86807.1 alpha-galactosidase [Flavivirga algicola]